MLQYRGWTDDIVYRECIVSRIARSVVFGFATHHEPDNDTQRQQLDGLVAGDFFEYSELRVFSILKRVLLEFRIDCSAE
jgi:hypothetical protein